MCVSIPKVSRETVRIPPIDGQYKYDTSYPQAGDGVGHEHMFGRNLNDGCEQVFVCRVSLTERMFVWVCLGCPVWLSVWGVGC